VGPGPRVRGWAAAFGRDEEAHYRRRWRAPHAAVRLLRTWSPTPKEYDSWAWAPVSEARSPWRVSGEIFYGVLGRQWGSLSLKRDSPERGSHSHHSQRPYAFEFSTLFCCRSRHGLARSSRAPPARGGTQLGAQPARMGCAGVCQNGPCWCLSLQQSCWRRVCVLRLQPPSGLALPISSFFVLLLKGLGLQPQHFTPCFILQAAIITYLCKMSVEATLLSASSSSIRRKGCSPAL
jgi:hypothetical protein